MLSSVTSTGDAWCDGGVSPVVDGVGPKVMRALVNYPVNCCAWRGVAWRGVAWRGGAWRGVAWRGVA
jgi:hypothetical protein